MSERRTMTRACARVAIGSVLGRRRRCAPRGAGYPRAMEASAKKAVNRIKSAVRKRQGPARKDQSTVPLADAMAEYWKRDIVTFSIPAHNGGRGPAAEFTKWMGTDVARCDLPTSHGLDTRDRAWQVQATAQELFADAVGAKETLFSTNGSSMSAHVAIMTVAGPGETIVMARNG